MKKKILALVCAMTMVCAMGLSVAAEESVTAGDVADAIESVAGSSASSITVTDDAVVVSVDGVVATLPVSAENREASAATADALIVTDGATVTPVTSADVTAIAKIAVEVANKAAVASDVEVKFLADVDNATTFVVDMKLGANDTAYALHYMADGTVEVIKGVSDGKTGIEFTLSSNSPVAVIIVTADVEADTTDEAPAQAPTVDATSPKTGSVAAVVAMLALISGCGAAVLGKKEN